MNLPDEDSYLKTREELVDQMTVLLGGRVAEAIVFGAVTTGAANDLQRVAEITHAMVHEYGMGTATASVRAVTDADIVSDLTRRIRDEEQQELAFEAQSAAYDLITAVPRQARGDRAGAPARRRRSSAPRSTRSWPTRRRSCAGARRTRCRTRRTDRTRAERLAGGRRPRRRRRPRRERPRIAAVTPLPQPGSAPDDDAA